MTLASVKSFLAGPHQAAMDALYAAHVTIASKVYPASVTVEQIQDMLVEGGVKTVRVASVEIRKTAYGLTAPSLGLKVTHNGTTYRIKNVDGFDEIDPVWRLECAEEYS